MTFLELCQMTVQQTGTIQGVRPTTVVGQVDRLKLICDYVSEAYVDIQKAHRMWRWMNSEFIGNTQVGVSKYVGTYFNDERAGTPITRFSQWGFKGDGLDMSLSSYLTSAGNTQEGMLRWREWGDFYETELRGPQTPGKPQTFSVTPDDKLIIAPVPNAIYTLRGKYKKAPQILAADGDVPEMPAEFHTIIKDAALQYVEAFDEGPRIPAVRLRMLPNFSMLESHQLPKVTWGGPLA